MKELTQVNLRDKHYLQQVQQLAEHLNITVSDVVKQAIAEKYQRERLL